jgi:clan AA aspartic protease
MGLTHVVVEVANPARPARRARVKMLVDSGAAYSVVDRTILRKIGIRASGSRSFVLADGTEITRETGAALFRFRGEEGASTVIFGEPGDAALLGVVTLEELGLILDPMRHALRPMPMSLRCRYAHPARRLSFCIVSAQAGAGGNPRI